ncbi:helix-turn-helix domain-containing protein [Saccharopolyspora phatthalungensis]|uniref:Transcriptional regulator with XRE-family HTH domain n=1 Tax=Saccharopolyspora phatthalungensis TaxID=664693 RepID=A0A840QGD8_9PSEU|nr:helix-turn-helix transcriptional regulator [Saccharopolyspora phatthalungensis]MBB5159161.1 transcriptional regulator with XRE-family HTH domain [Saccharopolyspora phatthalungensis]
MTDFDKRRRAFGDRLRQLREHTGLTGHQFAARAGWGQPKISKLENGRQTPTDSDIITWCQTAGTSDEAREDLRDALRDLKVHYESWRRSHREGSRARQEESRSLEQSAARIRAVDFGVVPGLLQIPDYASEVFRLYSELNGTAADIDEAVAARIQRQSILYDTSKRIEILIAEAALRYPVCSPEIMRSQLDRLTSLIGINHIRFGILPLDRQLPYMPMHGYWLLDDLALVENITAEIRITDEDEVATYHTLTDRLWNVAAQDDKARTILHHLTAT